MEYMADRDADPDPGLSGQVADLRQTLEELETEVDRDRPLRPPTPQELLRFTSEVTIPAIVLVLRTNIEALKLLQRTLRIADGRDSADRLQSRAESVATTALSQLDDTLSNLQSVVEGRPTDSRAEELLDDARDLRGEVERSLEASDGSTAEPSTVDIDVDEELRSIKDDLDDEDPGPTAN